MESWNDIVNTALLGTEKGTLRTEEADAAFAQPLETIAQKATDKEDIFLQTSALLYNYRQCGFVPSKKESLSLPVAEAEEKGYASPFAHAVLKDVVDGGSASLLRLWLEQCSGRSQIVGPDFLPVLLAAGVKTKSLQTAVKSVYGKRGEWLTQFNEEWKWGEAASDEERWQTGTLAQRKAVLAQIRSTAPAQAREWLQQTWPQEAAAAKAALLEEMFVNTSDEDLSWLEEVAKEKSKTVAAAAERLLGLLPSSTAVQRYQRVLAHAIGVTASKGLLGIGGKTSLNVKLSDEAREVFKAGAEEERDKKISEEGFILKQLIGRVPPRFWEGHFSLDRKKIIALFAAEEKYGPFTAALAKAAVRFRDIEWLRDLLATDNENFHDVALGALPQAEAEAYALRFVTDEKAAEAVLRHIGVFEDEWSLPFAKAVLRLTAKSPYHFHSAFYNNIARLLPVPVIAELEKCTPKEEHLRNMWSNLSDHITKLLTLKLQTLKAFNE